MADIPTYHLTSGLAGSIVTVIAIILGCLNLDGGKINSWLFEHVRK